jgi:Response regulator containing CheY-like receiver, AAA-type ATPase, and DNA-binding domains
MTVRHNRGVLVTEDFTILLVDDSALMRRLVREMLRTIGHFRVIEAANGVEALHRLDEGRVDLVLSDWNMLPVDGLDLLRAMRARPGLGRILFIMMTGEQTPSTIADAVAAGVSGYLTKPFDRRQLSKLVQQALAGRLIAA